VRLAHPTPIPLPIPPSWQSILIDHKPRGQQPAVNLLPRIAAATEAQQMPALALQIGEEEQCIMAGGLLV
jgi:hypothetical protein